MFPRQAGKTNYNMMVQLAEITRNLRINPKLKISVASIDRGYKKRFVEFAKRQNIILEVGPTKKWGYQAWQFDVTGWRYTKDNKDATL